MQVKKGLKVMRNGLRHWFSRACERILIGRMARRTYLLMAGHIYFQTLSAAVQLDLFTMLARRGRLSRVQIAKELGLEEKPVRILLLGCAVLGLVKRHRDGTYTNSRLSARLLNGDKARNILPVIRWQHSINYRAMYSFGEAVRANRNVGLESIEGDGDTLYQRLASHPDLERIFQQAMEAISVQANHLLSEAVDFSRFGKLVDVGGGNGTNIINLARQFQSLHAVVFDSASVCAIAEEKIRSSGLGGRLGTVAGDCFKDDFPKGCDAVLFAHFMTIWSEERNRALLRKAYAALPEGGAVLIFNMMQADSETGPLSAAAGSPYFLTLATGEGMLYTWSEYEAWVKEAGFRTVLRRRLIRDHGIIIGIK
jgi:ubiquinone/menaquinone biosynthesis C-methylase UbiE